MTETELKDLIGNVRRHLRVTKVVATRAIKLKNGEFYAGFAAAWNSVQPSGHAADLDMMMSDDEIVGGGMTAQESRVAYYLLAMQADIAAYEQAHANGALSAEALRDTVKAVKSNYGKLLRDAFLTAPPPESKKTKGEGGSSDG